MTAEFDLGRLKSGDREAFEALVRACEKKVYQLALRYTNNEADAMDISQEVFLRVYRSLPSFKGESAVTTWVYRITVNTAIDMTRKRARRRETSLTVYSDEDEESKPRDLTDERYAPEQEYEKTELRERVASAIAALPEDYRQIVILRDVNGLRYDEIAEILSVSEGTVKSRLFRARDKLRSLLQESGNISASHSSKKGKGGNR